VATRTGGPAEFVRHKDTGWTVPCDAPSIGEGLQSVLADDGHARRMGIAGRKEAETRFSWDNIATQTENIYLSIPRIAVTGQPAKTNGKLAAGLPTLDQIRRRAFEIYLQRDGRPGTSESDWRQAEREIRTRIAQTDPRP
jgi:hypothetical protein